MKKWFSFVVMVLLICALSVTAYAEDAEEVLVYEIPCDSAEGWSAPVDTSYPYADFLDAGGTVEEAPETGGYCLSLVGNPNAFGGPAVNFEYHPAQSIDMSGLRKGGELRFWLYTSDPNFNAAGECQFEISSSGGYDVNELHWNLSPRRPQLQEGWNEIVLKFSDGSSQGGRCDLSQVNYLRFWCLLMPENDTVKIGGIRFVDTDPNDEAEEPEIFTDQGPWNNDPPEPPTPDENGVTYRIDCDNGSGWRATDDRSWFVPFEEWGTVDTTDQKEGDGCLSCETTPYFDLGPSVNFEYRTNGPVNLGVDKETGLVKFWLFTSDANLLAGNAAQFEIMSNENWDTNELTWNLNMDNTPLQVGWNEITLRMADASYTNGVCDLSNVLMFRFYVLFAPENTTVKIDDICVIDTSPAEETEEALEETAPEETESVENTEEEVSIESVEEIAPPMNEEQP